MAKNNDIDKLLLGWKFRPGTISARLLKAGDGREVLQMRVEMGVLQMEVEGRPDGECPFGSNTYLEHLVNSALFAGDSFELSEEDRLEVDREFLQFHHRRICWLALRQFRRAVRDADHTLMLIDYCAAHSQDEEWVASHEQYRPFVLFQRAQAAALADLEQFGPEEAVEEIDDGLSRLHELFDELQIEGPFEEDDMAVQLLDLKNWIRRQYHIKRTLAEQLADAVAGEQYERAASLRDEIARRQRLRSYNPQLHS